MHYDPNGVFANDGDGAENSYAVIWTTTPWTIPANVAIAAHPEAEYAVVRATRVPDENHVAQLKRLIDGSAFTEAETDATVAATVKQSRETSYYLVAVPLVESVMNAAGLTEYETVKTVRGADLEGMTFKHPLFDRTSTLVLADYVTMDTGTGLVHTAPGHGKEDFETGIKYGLEVLNPVDAAGRYTAAAGEFRAQKFEGLRVTTFGNVGKKDAEANVALIEALNQSGNLLSAIEV